MEGRLVRVRDKLEIPEALDALALPRGCPVLVLVGGAGGMDGADAQRLERVLAGWLVPLLDELGAAVVDGGTDAGVMRLVGRAHDAGSASFALVGVAAEGTVVVPGQRNPGSDAGDLEPHHDRIVLVPGEEWGDEVTWLAEVASSLADGKRSMTLLVNGGEIAYSDIRASLDRGRPVVVLAGTGRTADAVAAAVDGNGSDPRARRLAESSLIRIVDIDDPEGLASTIRSLLVDVL